MLKGIGASQGYGIGNAVVISDAKLDYNHVEFTTAQNEKERLQKAVDTFIKETRKLADDVKNSAGDKEAEILEGHIVMLSDPFMLSQMQDNIDAGSVAEKAVDTVCSMFIDMFSGVDDELTQQRASDVKDIKDSLLSILLGVNNVDISKVKKGSVLIAKDFTPSMTGQINKDNVSAILTEVGGITSHSAILARAMGIPAVLSIPNVCNEVKNGDLVAVDGFKGNVIVSPSNDDIKEFENKQEAYLKDKESLKQYFGKPTVTKSGIKKLVYGNIGKAEDVQSVIQNSGEGIGLFRTEFLFMDRQSEPSEEEQFEAYSTVAKAMDGKEVIIRTLDVGGDKDIPYMGLTKEANPFLGYRAIRFCLDRVDIFTTQLRAILRASAYGSIRIMIPMITSVNEVRQVKDMIKKICSDLDHNGISYDKNIQIGVMIETPAAAIMADAIAQEVDFFSIGTNDLTQYTIAVDRCNENVAYLYSAFNPAVLRLIRRIIECAHNAGIEAGMCGEAAANALMAPILLSFGLDEFSVSTGKVLETRKTIADWTLKEAGLVTDKVMSMATEKEVTDYLSDYISERNKK